MANTIQIVIKATDDASKVISSVDQRMADFGKSISNLGNKLSVGLTLPFAAAGAAAIKMAMDMEQTTIAFTSMLGSADAAKKHLEALKDFAAKTPFEFTELTQASKRMMAFGFEAEKVVPMLRDIGDATSALGLGSEGINRITRALGQMQAKGKVSGEEMMQITEAGIPGWRYLAEAMGVTTAEVMKMSEQGLIPASKAIDAILAGMRGDFGGMMAAQSKTAAGQLSNLKDSITAVGTSLGEVMLPTVKSAIGLVSALADTLKGMSPEMQQIVVTTGLLAASLGPIMKIGGTLIGNFKMLKDVMIGVGGGALTMLKSVADVAGTLQRVGVTSYTVRDALIRLRASGALLSIELGIIGAGLIAIAKYLEEVGNAARASTDDLIEMSRSGDVFKQAAATTEIITHGQDRLKVALDATHTKIKEGAKDYADYKSSIEATAKAAGYEIDAQGNLIQAIYGTTGRVEKLVQANYALSESSYKADQVSRTQAYGIDLLSSSALRASDAIAQQAQTTADATVQQVDATTRHTEIMRSYSNELLYNVQQYQAQQAAAEAAAAAETVHRASIADSIASVDKLAQSLKDATSAQAIQTIAQGQLDVLKKSFESGKIGAEDFKKATDAVLLTYGLATPKSIALAEAQDKINQAFLSGQLPLDKYIASTAQIPKIAADGKVTLQELTSVGIVPTTAAARDQTTAVDNLTIAWSKVPQNVKTVYTVETKGTVPSGTTGGTTGKGYATGGNFTVPSGYPNDSFPMRVSSGEHVVVTPAGRGGAMPAINITQSFSGAQAQPEQYKAIMYEVITDVIEQAMRQ